MELDDCTAAELLARAEQSLLDRRQSVVDDLEICLAWADRHATVPPRCLIAEGVSARGGPRLVHPGGDGTPGVVDLAIHELSIARQVHVNTTRAVLADALDLRHRLPRCWIVVRELRCEPWLARKIATATRHLTATTVDLVDAAVAPCLGSQHPARVLEVLETAIVHADPVTHLDRRELARRTRGVHLGRSHPDTGLRAVFARIDAADATWLDATLETVTDLLAADPDLRRRHHPDLPETIGRPELRAVALGWLARPHDLADLLTHLAPDRWSSRTSASESEPRPADHPADDDQVIDPRDEADDPAHLDVPVRPAPGRTAVIYLHLDPDALTSPFGTINVEGLGAMVRAQLASLLTHCHISLQPVIDLATTSRINGYRHSDVMAERAFLRTRGEVFPHSSSRSRRLDADHVVAYDKHGPPGQTGDHNHAPLTRSAHRAKTHYGYQVHQLDTATWLWRTPHGLWRLVDHTGTHPLSQGDAAMFLHADTLDRLLHRAGEAGALTRAESN